MDNICCHHDGDYCSCGYHGVYVRIIKNRLTNFQATLKGVAFFILYLMILNINPGIWIVIKPVFLMVFSSSHPGKYHF